MMSSRPGVDSAWRVVPAAERRVMYGVLGGRRSLSFVSAWGVDGWRGRLVKGDSPRARSSKKGAI
jgi:hypothetical protein